MNESRLIRVELYGSEGIIVVEGDRGLCRHGGEVSCISSSGDSMCGGYCGVDYVNGVSYVRCGEDAPL